MLAALLLLAAPSLLAQGDDDGVTIELFTPGADETAAAAETTVGMGVDLVEFVIPGAEVRARPVKDAGRADVIVRIENVFAHGTDHRYNLEVTPLVEGVLDLRDHLERVDGTPLGDEVPEIRILVDAVTDEDVPFPVDPTVPHPGRVGGYTDLMMGFAVLWGVGLVCLIFLGRGRRRAARVEHERGPRTLAERLRAGGAGIEAFFTPTGAGTLVAEGKEVRTLDGRPCVLETALKPDVAIVRAARGDALGNLQFYRTARNFNPLAAMAGRVTVAEVDELVPAGAIDPDHVHLPGIFVQRVVHVPEHADHIEYRTTRPRP